VRCVFEAFGVLVRDWQGGVGGVRDSYIGGRRVKPK
jgi:hypothetical protein